MLIPIKRVYLNSGLEVEVLFNTNYIVKIESTDPTDEKPKTRIVYDQLQRDEPGIVYTNESLQGIKTKITRAKNKGQERVDD